MVSRGKRINGERSGFGLIWLSVSQCQFFRILSLLTPEISPLEIHFGTIPLIIWGKGVYMYASYHFSKRDALARKIEKSTVVAVLLTRSCLVLLSHGV